MPFPAVLDLSALDGANGYRLVGTARTDFSGYSVASLGDVNGDGIDDFIIGAPRADPAGSYSGESYVIFGTRAAALPSLNLSALDGTNGFRLSGGAQNNWSGHAVSSAGDFNGDGLMDLIIGARSPFPNDPAGPTFVVFGSRAGFPASLDLTTLNGANGFRILSESRLDAAMAVSAGDLNGDGLDDLILGLHNSDNPATNAGSAYVVFGRATPMAASFDLATLDGTNGFRVLGLTNSENLGRAVSVGDLNGDGVDDLIIGAPDAFVSNPGDAFIVFGRTTGFTRDVNVSTLDGQNGFRLIGPSVDSAAGSAVAAIGDINGDGFGDLAVNAEGARTAYVVFGHAGGFAASLNLTALNGSNGFSIVHNSSLGSVAGAGDVNGDGIADLIIGAGKLSPNGANSGSSFVLFGKVGGFGASFDLSTLDGTNGLRINGPGANHYAGFAVSGAGDVNGDGVDDLLIGAPRASVNDVATGASYIVFGVASPITRTGTAGADTLTGGAADDTLDGAGGADQLYGLAGRDTLVGGAGDDLLDGGDNGDLLNGGDGEDDLNGGAGGDVIYGDADADTLHGGADGDKLYGGHGSDYLYGDDGNDRLEGGGADFGDILFGGAGNDLLFANMGFMYGGAGNDIYILTSASEIISENANEGYDIVRTALNNRILLTNFEALELMGSDDLSGIGNAAANRLEGNGGANVLSGLDGNDTLNGNDGDDTLVGGRGNDLMRGGLGADTFALRTSSFAATLETDQIFDFSAAEGDIIDISQVDGNTRMVGDQSFRLVDAFSKYDPAHPELTGQMTLTFAGGITTLRLDNNGDGKVDYQMKINGDVTGESGDWLL